MKSVFVCLTLFLFFIIVLIIRYHSLSILNINLTTKNLKNDKPIFVLCTHDYEHVDLFCMLSEARKWFKETGIYTYFVVANKAHNYAFCNLMHDSSCIYVKDTTVKKVLQTLKHSHVCMFIYRNAVGTGAYHVAKESQTILAKIKSNVPCSTLEEGKTVLSCIRATYASNVFVEYSEAPSPNGKDAATFMKDLKKALYVTC